MGENEVLEFRGEEGEEVECLWLGRHEAKVVDNAEEERWQRQA